MVQALYQAQADAPNELLARPCRSLWDACLFCDSRGKAVKESSLQVQDASLSSSPLGRSWLLS